MADLCCHYCRQARSAADLRPYGPKGAPVCHPCATATPERRQQTEAQMREAFRRAEAASPSGVAVITATGVRPLDEQTLREIVESDDAVAKA